MSLIVVAHLTSKPETANQTRSVLEGLIGPTRAESGCIRYELHSNNNDPTRFCFIEEWTDDTALDEHLETPHLRALRERVPELLACPPDIGRYTLIG
jgi:quinol monooxygenase YgiN